MLNTMITVLTAYINYSALADSIKAAFENEFCTDLNDSNTVCKVSKEHSPNGTYYYAEIECTYSEEPDDFDTIAKAVYLTEDESTATDTLIKAATIAALATL